MKASLKNLIVRTITGFSLGALFWIIFLYFPTWCFSIMMLAILGLIIAFEWTRLFDPRTASFWFLMPFYPVLPFLVILWMNHSCYRPLLFILFITVSAHDTGSYIIGNLLGRHKIAELISPGKTWEGFLGGYAFVCGALWFALWELGDHKPWWFILGFSLIICFTSLLGDLFESWLKRRAGVKDSGTILPGHGGFLDRFDGILFTVIFFYLLRSWLLSYFPAAC